MEKLKCVSLVSLLVICLFCSAVTAKTASELLQEALYAEQVEGDLDAAVNLYEQVIKTKSAQRSHVAQAMYRQGMIYLKKKNDTQAKANFEKLIAEYSDQTKIIEQVQPLIDDLSSPDLASFMPSETLVYVELGSPGRQIETILNMLKGTPFENPLAAIAGGRGTRPNGGPGGKSPGDIMAALLNPSMMAEFKKIRGMAVGITGVSQNHPPMVAVLYPGKSDALRGIILALLGMVAQPAESIEGMQTLNIHNGPAVAYDDRVIIIAQPMEQLTWCVRQYKGVTNEPTFASNNKSFARVNKQARQENAMTIWANLDEVYSGVLKMIPEEHLPKELLAADAIADLKNIDDLVAYLSIQENGIAFESNIAFKDGHNCLPYGMIRTPNLTRNGFRSIPPEAAALVSLALAEPDSSSVATAQKAVKKITGLDIGREIFANIEQITLFVIPPGSDADLSGPPVRMLSSAGLAITSHNPQKTRQLLTQILEIVDVVAKVSTDEQSGSASDQYVLPLGDGQNLSCYIGQAEKTTLLTFCPEALENSLSAIKKRKSAINAGRLYEPLGQVAPDTSKLVLVNIGGAIQLADAFITMEHDNPQNPAHEMFAQLAQACDKTYVRLSTGESDNNFNLHLSVNNLPPVDRIFGLIMQLAKTDITAKVKATRPRPGNGAVIGLKEEMKLNWTSGAQAKSHKIYFGTSSDELSLLTEVSKPGEVELPALQEDDQYYWRVDEVWKDGTVITGDIWSFSIGRLVGWWKFDESAGTTAADSSDNGYDGTLGGVTTWVAGQYGNALAFDGAGWVDVPAEVWNDNITDAFSVCLWMYTNNATQQTVAMNVSPDRYLHLHLPWDGDIYFDVHHDTASFQRVNLGGTSDQWVSQWSYWTFVYTPGRQQIYLNGGLFAEGTGTQPIYNAATSITIGANNGGDQGYNGTIDDVRVYNYALSQIDIEEIYTVTATKPQPADGAVVGPKGPGKLSWKPAIGADSYRLYLGTEKERFFVDGWTTKNAEVDMSKLKEAMPEFKENTRYYWRIDKVEANGSVVLGNLWSFTTNGKLVGWWKFDETEGNTASDSSGNDHTGTLMGNPQWKPTGGKIGGALEYSNTDGTSYVEFPTAGLSTSAGTIALWGYLAPNQQMPDTRYLFGHTTVPVWDERIQLYMDWADTKLDLGLGDSHTCDTDIINLETETWYHVALTWDSGNYAVYVDGEQITTGGYTGLGTLNSVADIGNDGNTDGRTQGFQGRIDDVRIYNYPLGKAEIAELSK